MRNRTLLQIVKSYVYLIRGGGGKARGVAGYRAGWTAFPVVFSWLLQDVIFSWLLQGVIFQGFTCIAVGLRWLELSQVQSRLNVKLSPRSSPLEKLC